jgi:hypothetical protein
LGAGGIIGWKGQGGGGPPPPPPGTTPPGRKRPRPKRKTSVPSKEIPSEDRFIEISPGEFAHVNDRTGEVKLEDGTVITKDDLRDRWRAENDRALKNSDARFKKKQTISNVAIPTLKAINLGSDFIIGTLGKVTGPAGATLDTAYGVTKTFVSELSEGSGLKNATLSAGIEYVKGKVVGVISDKVPGLGDEEVAGSLIKAGEKTAIEKVGIEPVVEEAAAPVVEAAVPVVEATSKYVSVNASTLFEYEIQRVDPGLGSYGTSYG